MGAVYRARDTRLDRDVAIKVSTTEFTERFSREARSIAALNHSNVCHLYDVGPNYLVLEYVEGETLHGPMSFDEALPIIRQLIDGIEAAHEKNIIHRDLKTANIKITPEGAVKVLDFGLAKAAESERASDVANSPTFTMSATQAGVILGTAAYIPPALGGASWGDDGNIVMGSLNGLWRIPAEGGAGEMIRPNQGPQAFPDVLPGSRAVLFNSSSTAETPTALDTLLIDVTVLATGETKTLIRGGYWPRYADTPGPHGHLLYVTNGTLFGVGFDPERLELLGTPVPLVPDLAAGTSLTTGGGQFAFSHTGTLVYLAGRNQDVSYPMVWLEPSGATTPLIAQPSQFFTPRLSPDGKRLVYVNRAGGRSEDMWVYDLQRDTPTQLTFSGIGPRELAWAPDSRHIVYGDGTALWWVPVDGSRQPQRLVEKMRNPRPTSFAPDGRLVFSSSETASLPDVWTVPVDLSDPVHPKPGKPEPLLNEARVEVDPAFSPDGKFVAYASNESGREEVFVRAFPGPGGKWKVSGGGGKFPAWSRGTRELFFLGGDDRIMAASYTIEGNAFSPGKPRQWSPAQVLRTGTLQNFDVSPDGKRVVAFPRVQEQNTRIAARDGPAEFLRRAASSNSVSARDCATSA